ncbi:MAG: M1 family metallopeptidase [Chitinophagaceae bacterium]
MRYRSIFLVVVAQFILTCSYAQQDRWQQRVKYKMDVTLDVQTNIFKGKQQLEYSNNSPDTLKNLYYHLYWNAFQPESMMDVRNRELGKRLLNGRPDWESRVADRIQNLKQNEVGYQNVSNVKMNGRLQQIEQYETILKVILDKPIPPQSKVNMELDFEAQVPVQIRRSGRDNAEGVRYSMSQWYPKMAEYDYEGWHPTPYIAREFYGVWGDYDVKLTLDKSYVVAATGYIQNPKEVGHGYEQIITPATKSESKLPAGTKINPTTGSISANNLTWHFIAPNVHDFVWAADPEYKHLTKTVSDGVVLHAFYKISPEQLKKQYNNLPAREKTRLGNNPDNFVADYRSEWESVLDLVAKAFPYIEKTFGKYPYKSYSFIQGGDGGMEYPMATLLKGAGESVTIHELMHTWYQMMLGTNESMYAWMDEGFTSWAENRILAFVHDETGFIQKDAYDGYFYLSKSGVEEPLSTHADHFESRFGYTSSAYNKGAVFIEQLGYVVGAEMRDKIMLEYYSKWRFKHPNINDLMRIAENKSGMKLDWYTEYMVNTTKNIDYGIDSLWQDGDRLKIRIKNTGRFPMPIDLQLNYKDGSSELVYIPQYLAFGVKQNEQPNLKRTVLAPWKWTHPNYVVEIPGKLINIKSVEIDPSQRMADISRNNNRLELNW